MNSSGIFPTGTNYATWNATGGTAATSVASNDPAYHTPAAIPNGSIQVGQGFFIASKNNGNIEFNNSQRINDQNYQFLRASTTEKHRIWLNAKSEIGTDINQIMIGYLEGATLGKDTNYDGKSFGNIGSYLYSIIDSEQYVIQGRPLPFDASDEVYLGWKCAVPGNYSIQLSEWDGIFLTHQNVYIRDNLAGITTNIKQSPYYFTSNSGNFNNRFVLVFEANLAIADNSFSANNVIFYKDQGGLHITTEGIIMKDIFIYDLMGRLLYEANTINSGTITINEINQTKQIVLLKIVDQALQTVTLKIIN